MTATGLVVLLVLVVYTTATSGILVSTTTVTETKTATIATTQIVTQTVKVTQTNPFTAVAVQIGRFADNLDNRNVSGLASFYTNASVFSAIDNPCYYVTGNGGTRNMCPAPAIVFQGQHNISLLLYSAFFARIDVNLTSFAARLNSNLSTKTLGTDTINTTFTILFNWTTNAQGLFNNPPKGYGSSTGVFNATYSIQQEWKYATTSRGAGGGSWTIQRETWNELTYYQSEFVIG